jgi:hypothetical protein
VASRFSAITDNSTCSNNHNEKKNGSSHKSSHAAGGGGRGGAGGGVAAGNDAPGKLFLRLSTGHEYCGRMPFVVGDLGACLGGAAFASLEVLNLSHTGVTGDIAEFLTYRSAGRGSWRRRSSLGSKDTGGGGGGGNVVGGGGACLATMPLLRVLNLAQTAAAGDIACLAACPRLTEVNFFGCGRIFGDVAVFRRCPGLVSVQFVGCRQVKGNIRVFETTPRLQRLFFYHSQVKFTFSSKF